MKLATNEEIQGLLGVRNEHDYAGAVDKNKRTILINKQDIGSEDELLDTLIHECVHAVSYFMYIDLEEDTVQKLGTGLTTVFKSLMNTKEIQTFED